MRISIIIIVSLVLTSCLYSYSNIDTTEWKTFEISYENHIVRFESPGGYYQDDNLYMSDSTTGLLELHYDILSGPNIYGIQSGETRLYLRVVNTSFSGIDEYSLGRAELDCEQISNSEHRKSCVDKENLNTHYEGKVDKNWHLFIELSEEDTFTSYTFVTPIGNGVFLEYSGVISGRAFSREKVREERIRMIRDIFDTLTLEAGPDQGAIISNNALR